MFIHFFWDIALCQWVKGLRRLNKNLTSDEAINRQLRRLQNSNQWTTGKKDTKFSFSRANRYSCICKHKVAFETSGLDYTLSQVHIPENRNPQRHRRSRCDVRELTIKFANLILEGLFIMNLYQLDKQSIKFTIWKY